IRAALALSRGDWKSALKTLEAAAPLEFGSEEPFYTPLVIPPYLRALAFIAGEQRDEAATELEKLTSRPTLLRNNVILPLAREARAAL
ncbi:MAG TPA: hypothetical protein VHP62_05105, partial [Usitatibacter sp.]|nr:hypothetical protein [Usitatibacter sp.]